MTNPSESTFRGLRFAYTPAGTEPTFRGLRFAHAPVISSTFRGFGFSHSIADAEPTFRGLRFSHLPEGDSPELRGFSFSYLSSSITDRSFNADAYALATRDRAFNANTYAIHIADRSFSANAYSSLQTNKTFSTDAYSAAGTNKSFNADTYVLGSENRSFNADIFVLAQRNKDFSADTYASLRTNNNFSADTYSSAEKSKIFNADTYILGSENRSFNADLFALAQRNKTFSADTYASLQITKNFNADIYSSAEESKSFNADTYILGPENRSFNADAFAIAQINRSFSANTYASLQTTKNFNSDAYSSAEQSKSFSADIFSSAIRNSNFNADAFVEGPMTNPTEATFRGLRFSHTPALEPTFRGLRFSHTPAGLEPTFRGLSFSYMPAALEPTFRGLRFSHYPEQDGPELRGVTFAFEPLDTLKNRLFNADSYAAHETNRPFNANTFAAHETNRLFNANTFAAKSTNRSFNANAYSAIQENKTFNANAYSALQTNKSFNANAMSAKETNRVFNANAFAAKRTNADFNGDAYAEAIRNRLFNADADVVLESTVTRDFNADAYALKGTNKSFNATAFASLRTNKTFNATAIAAQQTNRSFTANTFAATQTQKSFSANVFAIHKDPSLILAEDNQSFTVNGGSATYTPSAGTSDSAVAANGSTLFAWIQLDALSNPTLVGRADSLDGEIAIGATSLSFQSNIEGVKVIGIPNPNNTWGVVFKSGTTIYYSLFDINLNPLAIDTVITTDAPIGNGDHFDIGVDDVGRLFVCFYNTLLANGECAVIQTATSGFPMSTFALANVEQIGINNIVVHRQSGKLTLLYVVGGTDLNIDSYALTNGAPSGPPVTVNITTGETGITPEGTGIATRYGNDGCIVAWINSNTGNNVQYRIYDDINGFINPAHAISGMGNIDLVGRYLSIDCSPIPPTQGPYSFAIKVSDNSSAGKASTIAWSHVSCAAGRMGTVGIDPIDQVIGTDSGKRSKTPVLCASEFQIEHMYSAAGVNPAKETYVNESIYMGLWKISRNSSIFSTTGSTEDNDSQTRIRSIYENYDGGNRRNSLIGTTISEYVANRSVDPTTATSFDNFLNTLTDEDSLFIGGPLASEVAGAIHSNNNILVNQLSKLKSEIEIIDAVFVNATPGVDGFAYLNSAPAIQITNNSGTFTQHRRLINAGTQVVDYALILRLGINTKSTQQTKAAIYCAGINRIGTEAAAYCLANPIQYRLGQGSGLLVVVTYPAPPTFNPITDDFDPTNTVINSIVTYNLSDILSDDIV